MTFQVLSCERCKTSLYAPVKFCPYCGHEAMTELQIERKPDPPPVEPVPTPPATTQDPPPKNERPALNEPNMMPPPPDKPVRRQGTGWIARLPDMWQRWISRNRWRLVFGGVALVLTLVVLALFVLPFRGTNATNRGPADGRVSGSAQVLGDTETFRVGTRTLRLHGIIGARSRAPREAMQDFIQKRGGQLECVAVEEDRFVCRTASDGTDIAELALRYGAARAADAAPASYLQAQALAQEHRSGIWVWGR